MTRSPRHAAQEDWPMDQLQTRLDALEQQVHPGNNIFITGANLHLGPIPTSLSLAAKSP